MDAKLTPQATHNESLVFDILAEIAANEGASPIDLSPPIGGVVDVELLERFVSQESGVSGTVEFNYQGYTITVTHEGEFSVEPHTN